MNGNLKFLGVKDLILTLQCMQTTQGTCQNPDVDSRIIDSYLISHFQRAPKDDDIVSGLYLAYPKIISVKNLFLNTDIIGVN